MIRTTLVALTLCLSQLTFAQGEAIELAREDIRAGRMGLIAGSMALTPEQQEKFWPIYQEYADEQEKLLDKRIAMLKEFVGNSDGMTDEMANSIAAQAFAIQRARTERRERYFKRFSEALGPVLAARFIQVDSQLATLMNFEMNRSMPLIRPPAADQ